MSAPVFRDEQSKGNTRIHMAAWTDSIDALQLLIDAGAQLNLQDADGDTPLSNAAHQGNMRAVQLLLKAGADPRIANLVCVYRLCPCLRRVCLCLVRCQDPSLDAKGC